MKPHILICCQITFAQEEVAKLLSKLAKISYVDSPNRKSFLAECCPGGKYANTVGIYRENESVKRIGKFDEDLIMGLPPTVKWIAHNGAGYDPVDVQACKARGIFLSNTPGSVNNATATTAVFLMISVFRGFSYAESSLRQLKWKPGDSGYMRDLEGKTLAILGLGGIGTRLAELAHAFRMRIIYFSRRRNPLAPGFCEYVEEVEEMIRQADVLSIHIPLRPETTGLVGERWIRMLKPGAVIINTARGKVIDEEALIRALEDRHLGGAGLDVFPYEPEVNPRLLKFRNVTLLPHMGTCTLDTQKDMEIRALTNLRDFLLHGKGRDLVAEFKVQSKL